MFTQSTFLKQSLCSSEKQYNNWQNILDPHLQHAHLKYLTVNIVLGVDMLIQYNIFKEMEEEMLTTDMFYAL